MQVVTVLDKWELKLSLFFFPSSEKEDYPNETQVTLPL